MLLPLSPDLEKLILEQAQALGYPHVDDYLRVIFGSAATESLPAPVTDDEFLRILAGLSSERDLPQLPDDFSRADIYADHNIDVVSRRHGSATSCCRSP